MLLELEAPGRGLTGSPGEADDTFRCVLGDRSGWPVAEPGVPLVLVEKPGAVTCWFHLLVRAALLLFKGRGLPRKSTELDDVLVRSRVGGGGKELLGAGKPDAAEPGP